MSFEVFDFVSGVSKTTIYIFLFILFSTYYLIVKCRRDPRLVKFSNTLPGPSGLPFVGNTLQFIFGGLGCVNSVLAHYSQTYGSVYKLWLGNELVVGLSNVDHLEAVFRSTKTLSKPKILFSGYQEQFGNSLFTASVPVWRETRKRLQPMFGKNSMKFQILQLNNYIDKYMEQIKSHVGGSEFNVKDYMQNLVIDSFLGLYYDIHLTAKEKEHFKFHQIFDSSTAYAFSKMVFPWLRLKYIGKLYFGNELEMFEKKLREFFNMLRKAESGKVVEEQVEENEKSDKAAKSVLPIIRQIEEEMKIEHYAFNEATNFVVAVAGTTASTISFCLLAIAMHADVQNRLFYELYAVVGDGDRPASTDDLNKLTYLDQVVKETQRRFTILRSIFREAEEAIQIGSITIPSAAVIMVRIGDVHMNPSLYPNPHEFNPDNFHPDAVSQRSKYSHLPLSSGIRDCIGKHFADTIIKLTVINLLRKFKLSTTIQMEDIDYTGAFSVGKRGGYWISIESRK